MNLSYILNTAWMLKCRAEHRRFVAAMRDPQRAQRDVLYGILARNSETEFGKRHKFGAIRSMEGFQQSVPLSTYEDYRDSVERIGRGAHRLLTAEPVLLFEPTSGTSGGEKLIPYTASLRREFLRGVAAWVADLFAGRPAIRKGRAYWSISPALGERRHTRCGIPVGFADDTAYLGYAERVAVAKLLVVPSLVTSITDTATFRYCTLLGLVAAEDLALISVWSPTFLTALLAHMAPWQDRLCSDIRHGRVEPPGPADSEAVRALRRQRRRDPSRAELLQRVLGSGAPMAQKLRAIWPRLGLVSCWADAGASLQAQTLAELFTSTEVQPKGLLATEACVSIPLLERTGSALALRSHFLEFEPCDDGSGSGTDQGRCLLAWELEVGRRYRVVVTTGGGLYRYQLRDEVEVVGKEHECPLIVFKGKSDQVSDLVGEKLAEPHVREALDQLAAQYGLALRFALVVPVPNETPRYRLYLQGPHPTVGLCESVARSLEAKLRTNPYYRQAVELGQLRPADVCMLDPEGEPAWSVYERKCLESGQRLGDIKPVALDKGLDWVEEFGP